MKTAVVAIIVVLAGAALAEISSKDTLILMKYKSDTKFKCTKAIFSTRAQYKADSVCRAVLNPGTGDIRYWQKVDVATETGFNSITVKRYSKSGCDKSRTFYQKYTLNVCSNDFMLTKK